MEPEIQKKPKPFIKREINSAIIEDNEYSEIENPYFSDNSSASQITNALRKFSLDFSKYLDKSDNDSSVGGAQPAKNQKLNYHQNVNETIEEVEDEKDELTEEKNNFITQSMERRRKIS